MGIYIPRGSLPLIKKFRSFIKMVAFQIRRPFAIVAFKIRENKERKRIVPRLWLSPGELLDRDLEYYEPQGSHTLDLKFIEDFAKARDELWAQIKKQTIFSFIVFAFACSKYFGIKLNLNVGGFSLIDTPGILEVLLLTSNLLSCYTLILQGNVFLIEAAIRHAIKRSIPEELRFIYTARYFPHEHFGVYQPFNLPHIIPNGPSRTIAKVTAIMFLLLLVAVYATYAMCNIALLAYFLWLHPQFGVASHILFAFILACGACAFLYLVLTRFRMPYLDYTVNNELQLLEQINPEQLVSRRNEIYGPIIEDRIRMEKLGFLKRRK